MKASIVAVGSEMLTPFRVDTNSLTITERLNAIGYDVRVKLVAGDDVGELVSELRAIEPWADLIVTTGGLGPTADDITRDAIAELLGVTMDLDERVVARIEERFTRRGMTMPAINRRQAMVPRGAVLIDNPNGTAPGLWIEHGRTRFLLLPGPPREMTPMLDTVIRERLATGSTRGLFRRVVKITGRSESDVDERAEPRYGKWTSGPVPIATTILAVLGQIELHLTAEASARGEADRALEAAVGELVEVLGDSIYSADGRSLEVVLGEMLSRLGLTISVAESCTGGLLASRITDVPGSSAYMDRGVVCYSNAAKTELADVPEALIREHGAVSEPVARAMATGIRSRSKTTIGIGVTGIAGPGGGTPEKPVGTVAIAVDLDGQVRSRTFQFVGNREMVKFQASQGAMNMLRLMILERSR
jgi:nicotinamide-nucleotide amidase